MPLTTRWSESAIATENLVSEWGMNVAYYMMFTGTNKIEKVEEFAFRWILWDVTVNGGCDYTIESLSDKLRPFEGTTANVSAKTLHTFLNGDIKRIAKERHHA